MYYHKRKGVTSAEMKVSEQLCISASKCNQIIGLIRRNIKAIVRRHLECCKQAWRPCRNDTDRLERLQRKATKIIPELRYHS